MMVCEKQEQSINSAQGGENMVGLVDVRKKKNLTQEGLAELIGVDRSTVAKWETGIAKPLADKLVLLAKVLECKIEDLF